MFLFLILCLHYYIIMSICALRLQETNIYFLKLVMYIHCRRLAVDHENVKPDLLILGKALSGGVLPVSNFIIVL